MNIEKDDILKEIKNLQINKATQDSDILTKLIKNTSDLFDFIFTNLNDCIAESIFRSLLKLVNITPVHKKDSNTTKDHYRPVSTLSNISKIYEKLMFKQMSKHFEPFFQNFSAVLEKVLVLSSVLAMLEKWKSAVNKQKRFGALLTGLSKT